jgi:hypothetical protein
MRYQTKFQISMLFIISPLTYICNKFPTRLKYAEMKPLLEVVKILIYLTIDQFLLLFILKNF